MATVGAVTANLNIVSATTAYQSNVNDFVLADASVAPFTVTLPAAPPAHSLVVVKKTDASANAVTIARPASTPSVTIDGNASVTLTVQGTSNSYLFDGSHWRVMTGKGENGAAGAPGTNGTNGTNGADGAPGVGVPTGGTTGQVLTKVDATNYNTTWSTPSGGGGGGSATLTPAFTTGYVYGRRSLCTSPLGPPTVLTLGANLINFLPIYFWKSVNFDTLYYHTGTTPPTAGANVRFGLYANNASNQPGALVTEFTTTPVSLGSSSGAILSYALTGTFPQGWSWLAISSGNVTPGTYYGLSNSQCVHPSGGVLPAQLTSANMQLTTAVTLYFCATANTTNPALPSAAPALTAYFTHGGPEIYFKVA